MHVHDTSVIKNKEYFSYIKRWILSNLEMGLTSLPQDPLCVSPDIQRNLGFFIIVFYMHINDFSKRVNDL